jgi:hypothetical protein
MQVTIQEGSAFAVTGNGPSTVLGIEDKDTSWPDYDSVGRRVCAKGFMPVLALFLAAFGAGCATGYKPSGSGGGYSETMYAPDVFLVHFDGN